MVMVTDAVMTAARPTAARTKIPRTRSRLWSGRRENTPQRPTGAIGPTPVGRMLSQHPLAFARQHDQPDGE